MILFCGLTLAAGFALAQDEPAQQSAPPQTSQQEPTQQTQPDQTPSNQTPSNQPPSSQTPPNQAPPDQTSPSANPPEQTSPHTPSSPDEKKDNNANPASSAAERTRELTMQAAQATRRVGQQTLYKVRDWETQWLVGAYVGRNRALVPLTAQGREEIYLHQTFLTPGSHLKRLFGAGIDQARGSPPQWGGGWGGYGARFASREGQFFAANSLAALANAKLRYEPRYDQCKCQGFWPRTRHAIVRNFITYNETEQELRPQWGLYGGAFGGGLISDAWKPKPRNAFAEGGRAMLGQAAWGVLANFFTEFAVDINRKLGAGRGVPK
jgi:hypothetical protein